MRVNSSNRKIIQDKLADLQSQLAAFSKLFDADVVLEVEFDMLSDFEDDFMAFQYVELAKIERDNQ